MVLVPRSALPLPDAVRQAVAAEKNLSETAFLECADDGDDFAACTRFRLRWFTPAIEVPLCGHATLASAAALLFGEGNPAEQLAFQTLSGELRVSRQRGRAGSSGDSGTGGGSLSMDLPLVPASPEDVPSGMEAGSALVQVGPACCAARCACRGRDGRACSHSKYARTWSHMLHLLTLADVRSVCYPCLAAMPSPLPCHTQRPCRLL